MTAARRTLQSRAGEHPDGTVPDWLYEVYDNRGIRQRSTLDPDRAKGNADAISGVATRTRIWYDARRYRCPQCSTVARWTDGVIAGFDTAMSGEPASEDEFWCQTCGAETPMSALTAIDEDEEVTGRG